MTIAELLVVLAVSSILLVALSNGQEFTARLSQRFFDVAFLEVDSRLLLEQVQCDLDETERLCQPEENHWLLVNWHNDTTEYLFADSGLARDGHPLVRQGVYLDDFTLAMIGATTEEELGGWSMPDADRSSSTTTPTAIHIAFTMSHKGRKVDIHTRYNLRSREPGA